MSKTNAGIETTQIESLKEVFDLILLRNNSEEEIINTLLSEITVRAALKGFPVLMSRNQVRELLGIDNNLIPIAHNRLAKRGFPLIRGSKWTATHAAILLNEINKMN